MTRPAPAAAAPVRRIQWGWLAASLVGLIYFLTSLVVVLNSIGNATGVVWLPSFPAWYYSLTRLLYWPFQPYFQLLSPIQSNPAVSYSTYALLSRAPFLLLPPVVAGLTVARWRRAGGRRPARRLDRPAAGSGASRAPTVLLALAVAVVVGAYLLMPPLRAAVNAGVTLLDPRNIEGLRDYLRGFGALAPVVSFLLMVFQSVAAPLPAFAITLANGLLFGAFWGAVLSWSSAMVGAMVCFGIARALGRPVVDRLVGSGPLAKADSFFERYGAHAVLITRLIPLISFDVVSYAAGLTPIRLAPFLIATGIGQLPATIAYSILGENLTGGSWVALWAIGVLASLMVAGWAVKRRLDRQTASPASPASPAPAAAGTLHPETIVADS